jgi:hypothetical protein
MLNAIGNTGHAQPLSFRIPPLVCIIRPFAAAAMTMPRISGRYKLPDTIMHTRFDFYFRDTSDLVHYPVNESMVNGAQVLIKNYGVVGHFTMPLTIPAGCLPDWSPR